MRERKPSLYCNSTTALMAQIDVGGSLERHAPKTLSVTCHRESESPGIARQEKDLLYRCLTELPALT